jgi:hypothetical protein
MKLIAKFKDDESVHAVTKRSYQENQHRLDMFEKTNHVDICFHNYENGNRFYFVDNGNPVGFCDLWRAKKRSGYHHVNLLWLHGDYRGKDIVIDFFMSLLERDHKMVSDQTHTPASKTIWLRLWQQRGVPIWIIPADVNHPAGPIPVKTREDYDMVYQVQPHRGFNKAGEYVKIFTTHP